MLSLFSKLIRRFALWLDRRVALYRPAPAKKLFTPANKSELVALLRRTPKHVFTSRERQIFSAATDFNFTKVADIMLPASEIIAVKSDELLGPLLLDKLYRSGFSYFPIRDHKAEIIGILNIKHLTNLDIKEAITPADLLDPNLCYIRSDYSLMQAVAAFARTNAPFAIIIDSVGRTVGLITPTIIISHLTSSSFDDDFAADDSRTAVSRRRLDP